MKRVLFVDDEPMLLAGLRNLLRPQRHRWEMQFIGDPHGALRVFQDAPFDVVVSDMRMPHMDGAALVEALRRTRQDVRSILLTGYAEALVLDRARRVCDLVLGKPCHASELVGAIERLVTPRPAP